MKSSQTTVAKEKGQQEKPPVKMKEQSIVLNLSIFSGLWGKRQTYEEIKSKNDTGTTVYGTFSLEL